MKKIRSNNGGFTLIEIIIVIVILGILAAVLVPSMIKWIDNAKQKSTISAADTVRQSVTASVADIYKDGKSVDGNQNSECYDTKFWKELQALTGSGVQCTDPEKDEYTTFVIKNGSVTELTYKSGDWTASYKNGSWDCAKS